MNGNWGAGIGEGDAVVSNGTVEINGGCVTASGNNGSAGIGGVGYSNGCDVTITVGYVTATGSAYNNHAAPGIGSGRTRADGSQPLNPGTVKILGGTVISKTVSAKHAAMVIGVNKDNIEPDIMDFITLKETAAYFPIDSALPAIRSSVIVALGSSEFKIASCPHSYENGVCIYCGADVICGDVNLDGSVTPPDAMILTRYLAGWNGYTVNALASDVDGDKKVTVRDAVILARHLSGWNEYRTLPYTTN